MGWTSKELYDFFYAYHNLDPLDSVVKENFELPLEGKTIHFGDKFQTTLVIPESNLFLGEYKCPYPKELADAVKQIRDKDKAKRDAHNNKMIKLCQANNYMGMSLLDIEWLAENGYLVEGNGSNVVNLSGGGCYMTVYNKWGKKRRIRLNSIGIVIAQ